MEEEDEEEKEKKAKNRKKSCLDKLQGDHCEPCYDKKEREWKWKRKGRQNGRGKQKKSNSFQIKTSLGNMWEVALSSGAAWTKLSKCQCCGGRITKKRAGDENAKKITMKRRNLE